MPVPGWRLRTSLAASIPSREKVRGHANVGDDDVRIGRLRSSDESVEVGGLPDDFQILFEIEQRLDAFPHDEVVVGEKHRNGQRSPPQSGECTWCILFGTRPDRSIVQARFRGGAGTRLQMRPPRWFRGRGVVRRSWGHKEDTYAL